MTDLSQLLADATSDISAGFDVHAVRVRVVRRRRRRVAAGGLVVVLLAGVAGLTAVAGRRPTGTPTDVVTTASPSPWAGRWIAFAFSTLGEGPSGRSAEIRLDPDGELYGFDGCGELEGKWTTPDRDRLVVTDYRGATEKESMACSVPSRSAAKSLAMVLTGLPQGSTMTPFNEVPDSLKLSAGGVFIGFARDVSYRTATDPSTSGEVIDLADPGYKLLADYSFVAASAEPEEIRQQRWRHDDGSREVSVRRQLGGMPLSPAAVVHGTVGATATAIDVNGHPGVMVTPSAGTGASISWMVDDGITLTVVTQGQSAEEALAAARQLRYRRGSLDAKALTTARAMDGRANITRPAEVAATGTVGEASWRFLVYGSDQGTCTQLVTSTGALGECGDPHEDVEARVANVLGGRVIRGSVPEEATRVRVEWDDGSAEIPAVPLGGFQGRRYFASTLEHDMPVRRVVALREAGVEIAATDNVSTGGAIGSG